MMSRMFSASRRVRCSTTSTSGFSASIEARADEVVGDESDGADACCREIERGRGTEPASADQQDLGIEELHLPLDPHLGKQRMARITHPLLGTEALGGDDG